MTTTTGGAARVLAWLEEWLQTEWPDLKVYCTSVTEHISTIAAVGPKSRQLLQELVTDIDLSKDAFPFMHSRRRPSTITCAYRANLLFRRAGIRESTLHGAMPAIFGNDYGRSDVPMT
jgi:glycine cleavage system aminomethyltransferase T